MTTVTVTTRYPYNGNGTNSTTNTGCNSTYLWQGSVSWSAEDGMYSIVFLQKTETGCKTFRMGPFGQT